MNFPGDRSKKNRLPSEEFARIVRRYADEHDMSIEAMAELLDINYGTVEDLYKGSSFAATIGFAMADQILCKLNMVDSWWREPLLSHYDRILAPPPKYFCKKCGKPRENPRSQVCVACTHTPHAKSLSPCRRCGGEKQRGYGTSPFCTPCREASAEEQRLEANRRRPINKLAQKLAKEAGS